MVCTPHPRLQHLADSIYLQTLKQSGLYYSKSVYVEALSTHHLAFRGLFMFSHPIIVGFLNVLCHVNLLSWNLNYINSSGRFSCWLKLFIAIVWKFGRSGLCGRSYLVLPKELITPKLHPRFLPKVVVVVLSSICTSLLVSQFFPKNHLTLEEDRLCTLSIVMPLLCYLEKTN